MGVGGKLPSPRCESVPAPGQSGAHSCQGCLAPRQEARVGRDGSLEAVQGLSHLSPGRGPCSAPSRSQEASPERQPCLAGPKVLACYCYYCVPKGQITALPVKRIHLLLSPLEHPKPLFYSQSHTSQVGCEPPKASCRAVRWSPSQWTSVQ